MVLDDVLKSLGNLAPGQRKVLAKDIISTDFFLALLVSGFINSEKPRLKTLVGFDTAMYEDLMILITHHPRIENITKKAITNIENSLYEWLSTGTLVSHYEVYDAFGF